MTFSIPFVFINQLGLETNNVFVLYIRHAPMRAIIQKVQLFGFVVNQGFFVLLHFVDVFDWCGAYAAHFARILNLFFFAIFLVSLFCDWGGLAALLQTMQ